MAMLSMRDNVNHVQRKVLIEKQATMLVGSWILMEWEINSEKNSVKWLKMDFSQQLFAPTQLGQEQLICEVRIRKVDMACIMF